MCVPVQLLHLFVYFVYFERVRVNVYVSREVVPLAPMAWGKTHTVSLEQNQKCKTYSGGRHTDNTRLQIKFNFGVNFESSLRINTEQESTESSCFKRIENSLLGRMFGTERWSEKIAEKPGSRFM